MLCALHALAIASSLPSVTALTVASHQNLRAQVHALAQESSRAQAHLQQGLSTRAGERVQTELVSVNPIAKVVNLLKKMLEMNGKVDAEDNALCEKTICECTKDIAKQQATVEHYAGQLPALEDEYRKMYSEVHIMKLEIRKAEKEKADAEKTLAELKASRDDKSKQQIADYKVNIEALGKAIKELHKGLGGTTAFLQSGTADTLRQLITSADMTDTQRDSLGAFLDQGNSDHADSTAPGTEEIIGMLKQMKDTMETNLKELETGSAQESAQFEALVLAKQKEIDDLGLKISQMSYTMAEKLARLTELDAQIRSILKGGYLREQQLLEEMKEECDKKKTECAKNKKLRAEEATALSECIALLNSDEALEMFKKTLPRTSEALLQIQVSEKQLTQRADAALNKRRKGKQDYRIDAISLAMQGKKVDMTKVVEMVDTLIAVLNKESEDDAKTKDDCIKSLGEAMFKKKVLGQTVGGVKAAIAETQAELDKVKGEIAIVSQSLKDLDAEVAEKGDDRKAENAQYVKEMSMDRSAMDLLKVARSRLVTFYGSMLQMDKGPQNGQEVIGELDKIIQDLTLLMDRNGQTEKSAQEKYETILKEAEETKEAKLDYLQKLNDNRVALDQQLAKHKDDYRENGLDDMANEKTIMALHKRCDWLMENYDERVEARNSEIDSLKNAKTVLLGGDVTIR